MSEAVLNLLKDKGLHFIPSGRDYLIKCLNPEHDDSHPSLRVDKISGVAHCFACGWKRNLFKHYGIITNNTPVRIAKLKDKLKELRDSMKDMELPKGATPYTKAFRGISAQTIKHFEAFYTHDVEELKDRVIFPIKDVTGKMISIIGRHVDINGKPKYIVNPHGASLQCYPLILPPNTNSIILVEGMLDMLNMYDKGARNVVSVFGTQALKNSAKSKLLPFKVQGVTRVYILFDGDEAGQEAAKELKPIIEEQGFVVEVIVLPEGMDPGELDEEHIQSIIEYTK